MDVALFVTCLTDTFYPRTGIAVVKVLEHLGCRVHFPEAQTCCGQPMFNSGFHNEAGALAKHMVEVFEPFEYVVTPSGSCCAMIRDYYGDLLDDDHAWSKESTRLVGKTYEFVEFLKNVLKVDLTDLGVKWNGKVTYHYSCHLRGIGMTDEAVQLMAQISGLEHIPLENAEHCCGFGGTFAVKYPKISGTMARDKVERIRATGTDVTISNDAGCTMNLSGSCRREGYTTRFMSLAEVIAEGLGLLERTDAH